jgi:exosortase/archaeosortase family protein
VPRLAVSAGLLTAGLLVILATDRLRGAETWLSSLVAGVITRTPTSVLSNGHTFLWGLGTSQLRGLTITPECTVALIAGPLLLLAALLASTRRLDPGRVLGGAALAVAVVMVTNLTRIALIVVAFNDWGNGGFWWAHVLLGSVVTTLGTVAGVGVLLFHVFRPGVRRA